MHSTPQKGKPTGAGTTAGESKEKTTSAPIVSHPGNSDKRVEKQAAQATAEAQRFAMLAARAALAGQSLLQTSNGYILSRWTYSKHCADLDTVESLLGRTAPRP